MAKPTIRTPYDGLPKAHPGVRCTREESKTVQSHKEYCDIDKQIQLAGSGNILQGNAKAPIYGDFSEVPKDLLSQHALVKQFEEHFHEHKPEIRGRFDNNPAKMAEYLMDPANLEESYTLGLRQKPVKQPETVDHKAILKETIREVIAESNGGSAQ